MCAIHGILWSRELKLSQCHNRTVVTTPSPQCLCRRDGEWGREMEVEGGSMEDRERGWW
jgi:hypothetical protein